MAAEVFSSSPLRGFGNKRSNGDIMPMEPFDTQQQKRRRGLQEINFAPSEIGDDREMSRAKRSRAAHKCEDENMDTPIFSQRQMLQFEQGKNAEIQRLRSAKHRARFFPFLPTRSS